MNRIEITRPMVGLLAMQVCTEKDATDAEILEVCNRDNPSGTSNGWMIVLRNEILEEHNMPLTAAPGPCEDYPERIHYLVLC